MVRNNITAFFTDTNNKEIKCLKTKAFSLMEIIVALAILSVIALLILPNITGKTEKARRTAALMDIETGLANGLDEYEADNGRFPSTEQGLEALLAKPSKEPVPKNWQGPYLKKKKLTDPWGNRYIYKYPGAHNKHMYDLSSYASDGKEGGEDINLDINNWE